METPDTVATTSMVGSAPRTDKADRRLIRCLIAVLYATAVAWGLRNIHHDRPSMLDVFVPVVTSVALAWWAIADSRRRGKPLTWAARPFFVILAVPVVPIYFIWTRRLRGLGWVVLHTICWHAAAIASMFAGGIAMYGTAWLYSL